MINKNQIEFKNFLKKFTLFERCNDKKESSSLENSLLKEVISNLGANSYNQGLFFICDNLQIKTMTQSIEEAFPKTKDIITCFARDWLNRRFAVRNEEPYDILRFDVVFNEVITIPVSLKEFFESEIVKYSDDLFSEEYFYAWSAKNKNRTLSCKECVDFKVSPSLGGEDNIDNLEVTDCDVAWHLNMQLSSK